MTKPGLCHSSFVFSAVVPRRGNGRRIRWTVPTETEKIRQELLAMSDNRIPMTRDEFEARKGRLEQMQTEMLEITKRVAAARDLGDLSENAEYHAAREDQGLQQAKINQLRDELARAYIVDLSSMPKD